ncbi:hypothetical protein E2C01_039227 [Portunus trituberculatus]|uniref:Uncharacterized protein n=1 Tax=Portunus trituberculatus TaxID=210409 RepID=A0A5B7FJ42_PORTR|nr:hypothetical protein [Portunus trituberculatus]
MRISRDRHTTTLTTSKPQRFPEDELGVSRVSPPPARKIPRDLLPCACLLGLRGAPSQGPCLMYPRVSGKSLMPHKVQFSISQEKGKRPTLRSPPVDLDETRQKPHRRRRGITLQHDAATSTASAATVAPPRPHVRDIPTQPLRIRGSFQRHAVMADCGTHPIFLLQKKRVMQRHPRPRHYVSP